MKTTRGDFTLLGTVGMDELMEGARLAARADLLRMVQHADAELLQRLERYHLRPDKHTDEADEEFRQILLALHQAERDSPAEVAKRQAEEERRDRGEYNRSYTDALHAADVLGVVVRDEEDPTREELAAAYWTRRAAAETAQQRHLVTAAFQALRTFYGYSGCPGEPPPAPEAA